MRNRYLLNILGAFVYLPCLLSAQISTPPSLRLVPPNREIYHELAVSINAKDSKVFKTSRGLKMGTVPKKMSFDNEQMQANEMKLRGKTSLKFRRKSYAVELENRYSFVTTQGSKSFKRFHLLSLTMDQGYFGNRLAFACAADAGIFKMYHTYVELKINGQSEGLYEWIERPEDHAIADLETPYVLRRSAVDFLIADFKLAKDQPKEMKQRYDMAYQALLNAGKNLEGEAQFNYFQKHLDLDAYCTWLALNTWLQNGDYTDELFFYVQPRQEEVRFGIIPWDFDDIFAQAPHEGWLKRNEALGEKLLFSSEVGLDRSIANNPLLYAFYQQKMKALLNLFPEEKLRGMFAEIYQELYPYFQRMSVLEMSQYDRQKKTSPVRLEQQMNEAFRFLLKRRGKLLGMAG